MGICSALPSLPPQKAKLSGQDSGPPRAGGGIGIDAIASPLLSQIKTDVDNSSWSEKSSACMINTRSKDNVKPISVASSAGLGVFPGLGVGIEMSPRVDPIVQPNRKVTNAEVFNRIKKLRKLANTHFGSVWEGFDNQNKIRVAVKQSKRYHAETRTNRKSRKGVPENVFREIKIHRLIKEDPHCPTSIIHLYEVIETETDVFMIMEFGDGGTLFDRVFMEAKRHRRGNALVTWRANVKRWFFDMVRVVDYMHGLNVCHKDLSLQNVLMKTNDGGELDIRIVDLGLAEVFRVDQVNCVSRKKVGKSNFASPECYDPDISTFDAKANDIWCLGVMLFMMHVKCSPYENPLDGNARELMRGRRRTGDMLRKWGKQGLLGKTEAHLLSKIFVPERHRFTIKDILDHQYCLQEDVERSSSYPVEKVRRMSSSEIAMPLKSTRGSMIF